MGVSPAEASLPTDGQETCWGQDKITVGSVVGHLDTLNLNRHQHLQKPVATERPASMSPTGH